MIYSEFYKRIINGIVLACYIRACISVETKYFCRILFKLQKNGTKFVLLLFLPCLYMDNLNDVLYCVIRWQGYLFD